MTISNADLIAQGRAYSVPFYKGQTLIGELATRLELAESQLEFLSNQVEEKTELFHKEADMRCAAGRLREEVEEKLAIEQAKVARALAVCDRDVRNGKHDWSEAVRFALSDAAS